MHARMRARASNVRRRENAESIAFYRGGARELHAAMQRLALLVDTALVHLRWLCLYELWSNVYNYATLLVPALMVAPR